MTIKREVETEALKVVGTLISDAIKRDSIHVATEPVYATETLNPGQRIVLTSYQSDQVRASNPNGDWQGIVDPFLPRVVKRGERFLMFLKPGSMLQLRHVWDCPGFKPSVEKEIEYVEVEACCAY